MHFPLRNVDVGVDRGFFSFSSAWSVVMTNVNREEEKKRGNKNAECLWLDVDLQKSITDNALVGVFPPYI